MSLAYGPLAAWYDKLTLDVPYEEFLGFYEREFKADGGEFQTIDRKSTRLNSSHTS